ncbi:hypothetical protein SAMN05444515_10351 [Ectothiorhodospira marina]|uniref:Uncharacterized protein n=1 Tax=Ectothiorhodospira marina TaxID=1396821 RepID=A0A1H7I6Z8_9GAMM|nr:hypothetical protein SAMN05444515_10351 [Ectothiorhodospira marina]
MPPTQLRPVQPVAPNSIPYRRFEKRPFLPPKPYRRFEKRPFLPPNPYGRFEKRPTPTNIHTTADTPPSHRL